VRIDDLGGQAGPRRTEPPAAEPSRPDSSSARPAARDRADLSDAARARRALFEAATALPDVRADRVDALRRALDEGTYTVDARKLAQAILEFEDDLRG
jgi:negative regulator of flagellin synthesis FlgM